MKYFFASIALGLIFVANLFPSIVLAQADYKPLAPIPEYIPTGAGGTVTIKNYIEGMFVLIIAVATGLAVLMIIFGGIKYMTTDAFQGKSDAKTTIQNAIWGLLLAIGAWLILNTIDPNLVNLNITIPGTTLPTPPPPRPPVAGACPVGRCAPLMVKHSRSKACAPVNAFDPCLVDSELNSRLGALDTALERSESIDLYVNEAWPPTVNHADPCHYDGTCVDIESITDSTVYGVVRESNAAGLGAWFETTDPKRKESIIMASCNNQNIYNVCKATLDKCILVLPPGSIKGEHFSVYKASYKPCP